MVDSMGTAACDIVIPCRDEARALPAVLAAVPAGFRAIVVDNGSTDGTADVARRLGAQVVVEDRPGYGAAVQAGVEAAEAPYVAIIDGDDSLSLDALPPMLAAVRDGEATMAVGRRRPVSRGVWPWHARLGTKAISSWLRWSSGLAIHDLAPVRISRRRDLLDLDVQDRRFGYPLELMRKAAAAQWTIREFDVDYRPRAAGTKSKVSGSLRGTVRTMIDFTRVMR
jgi:glycosyltransferase involved in cell wall biosynthesis